MYSHFHAILSKQSLTAGIVLIVLPNPFFKSKQREKWNYVYSKIGITQRFNFEADEQMSQSGMVEVKEVTYGEGLLRQ